jgi:MHS family proline/betaine transporter-like MFS transporter
MGFSVGGEYTGVVAYLLEGARRERRGLVASSASAASEIGALLAVGMAAATVSAVSATDLQRWGWRIPFFVGAALAGSVWIARSTMHESPEFIRQQAEGTVPKLPLHHSLKHHKGGIARAFSISALGSITYYVGITYVPAFLTSVARMSEVASLWLSTIAAVAVILVTPLTGILSDRVGRKPVLVVLCVLSAVLPTAMFSLMAGSATLQALGGSIVLAGVAGAVSAVGAVATAEQFPGEGRVTGLALGATMATAVFGGLTPYLAQVLVERMHWPSAPGAMIAIVAVLVLPIFVTMRETAPNVRRSR